MGFLVGLLPALFWGVNPVFVNKIGGKPINQQLGTAFGCGITALVIYFVMQPTFTTTVVIGCIISGLAWSVGQLCQYTAYTILGTSKAFALSISFEMLLNAIVGVLVFHEWTTTNQIMLGVAAIACVVIGGNLTSFTSEKTEASKEQLKKGVITLLIGAAGYCTWNYALRVVGADGIEATCPQAIGMVLGSLVLGLFVGKDTKKFSKTTAKLVIPGLVYSGANATLVLSNILNGVAIGYTMAQFCLVVEMILGFVILKEHKNQTSAELKHAIGGAVLITAGCIMVGLVGYV